MQETTPIGIALRALRENADMTLERVAQEAGVSISYLSRAENGQVTPTSGWVQMVVSTIGTQLVARGTAA